MSPTLPIKLYAVAYFVLFLTWAGVVFCHVADAAALVSYIQGALAMLSGHVLTMINSSAPPASKLGFISGSVTELLPGPAPTLAPSPAPAPAAAPAAGQVNAQAGRALPSMLMIIAAVAALLSGCGAMNAYSSAALTNGAADYASARKNVQSADDAKLQGWMDSACAMNVGALQRAVSTSSNPHALNAVLAACPVPGIGVTSALPNGTMNVQTTTISVPGTTPVQK